MFKIGRESTSRQAAVDNGYKIQTHSLKYSLQVGMQSEWQVDNLKGQRCVPGLTDRVH